jgi:hypothetical protein
VATEKFFSHSGSTPRTLVEEINLQKNHTNAAPTVAAKIATASKAFIGGPTSCRVSLSKSIAEFESFCNKKGEFSGLYPTIEEGYAP